VAVSLLLWFQKQNGCYETVFEVNCCKFITAACNEQSPTEVSARSGVTVIVTPVAAGQNQQRQFYSGVGIFNWYYPSSTPRELRSRGVYLE
jgi:hypothetical protein